jgi:hypothetical protein
MKDGFHYLGTLQQCYFLNITHVRCRPSSLMHWCTRFKTLSITRSNMAFGMALISLEILCLRLCKSAGRAYKTLLYNQPHENKSQTDRSAERTGQEMSPSRGIMWYSKTVLKVFIDCRAVSAVAPSCCNQKVAMHFLKQNHGLTVLAQCVIGSGEKVNQNEVSVRAICSICWGQLNVSVLIVCGYDR